MWIQSYFFTLGVSIKLRTF